MCNHFSIFKLFFTHRAISSLMRVAPAVVLCVAGYAPAAAQIPGSLNSIYVSARDEFEMMGSNVRIYEESFGSFPPPRQALDASEFKISADELRHPLTDKGRRILLKAWNYSKKGDHSLAIATIREGVTRVRSLIPYSHGFLGIEYIQTDHAREAVAELKEFAELFPHDAPGRSNLALSLCLTGDLDGAEREAKLALYLEPTLYSAVEIVQAIEQQSPQGTFRECRGQSLTRGGQRGRTSHEATLRAKSNQVGGLRG